MDSYDVLVIILSVTLAVFLTLAIIATVMIIKLLKKVDVVVLNAQQTSKNIEAITASMRNVASGATFLAAINRVYQKFKR